MYLLIAEYSTVLWDFFPRCIYFHTLTIIWSGKKIMCSTAIGRAELAIQEKTVFGFLQLDYFPLKCAHEAKQRTNQLFFVNTEIVSLKHFTFNGTCIIF